MRRLHTRTMASVQELVAEFEGMKQRLYLSEQHGVKLAESIDTLRAESDSALRAANGKIEEL